MWANVYWAPVYWTNDYWNEAGTAVVGGGFRSRIAGGLVVT